MFVVYAAIIAPVVADAAGHLLTASLRNAPAGLAIAAPSAWSIGIMIGRLTTMVAERRWDFFAL